MVPPGHAAGGYIAGTIAAAQTNPIKGDIQANVDNHLKLIELALVHAADLIIFPELSLTGYEPSLAQQLAATPDDPRLQEFQAIADTGSITIGAGLPLRNEPRPTISMVIFQPGRPRQIYHKRYIHADEEPFFVGGENSVVTLNNYPGVALAICYEISVGEHAEAAGRAGAAVYAASVVKTMAGTEKAHDRLAEVARAYSMAVVMANSVGVCDGEVCGGRSAVWDKNGRLLGQLNDSGEGLLILDTVTEEVTAVGDGR